MLLLRPRVLMATGMTVSVLFGLAVAESSGATTPDGSGPETTVVAPPDSTVAGSPGTGADSSVASTPDAPAVEILPPDESWGGATRGEWDARWWQWASSLPEEVNPNVDPTGGRCGYGQFGPMFFLPASFGGESAATTCVVPEGTAIYASAAGSECSTVEPPPFFGRTEEELRACAATNLDAATDFQVAVNGQDLGDLEAYRTGSPLFTMTFPENNIFGVEPGVAQAVSESYGFIIAPPPPGRYVITGSTTFAGDPEPFVATVNVIVEAPQVIETPPTNSTAP